MYLGYFVLIESNMVSLPLVMPLYATCSLHERFCDMLSSSFILQGYTPKGYSHVPTSDATGEVMTALGSPNVCVCLVSFLFIRTFAAVFCI